MSPMATVPAELPSATSRMENPFPGARPDSVRTEWLQKRHVIAQELWDKVGILIPSFSCVVATTDNNVVRGIAIVGNTTHTSVIETLPGCANICDQLQKAIDGIRPTRNTAAPDDDEYEDIAQEFSRVDGEGICHLRDE